MRKSIWHKKIPTLLGMLFLVLGIGMTSLFAQRGTNLFSKAGSSDQPVDIQISNISDSTATVSFTTPSSVIATLSYGKQQSLNETASDQRDQQAAPSEYKTHIFTLTDLSPETQYSFTIISAGNTYLNNGQPFQFTTGPQLQPSSTTKVVSGKVITPAGEPAKGALVYISSDALQQLSTITALDGTFSFTLVNARSKDTLQQFIPQDTLPLQLMTANGSLQSHVFFTLSQANPIPTFTLGNDYDFTATPILPTQTPSDSAKVTFPSVLSANTTSDVQILTPTQAAIIAEVKPVFTGIAKPNVLVQIIIKSPTFTARVLTNSKGAWTYQPRTALTQGEHTISVTAKDKAGEVQTITQTFTIASQKQSTQTLGAQAPTPTKTPIPTRTPTPTRIPTRTPTPTAIPTRAPTPTPTHIPTPTPSPTTAPKQVSVSLPVAPTNTPVPTVIAMVISTPSPTPTIHPVFSPSPTLIVTRGTSSNSFLLSFGFLAGLVGIIGTVLYFFTSRTFPI